MAFQDTIKGLVAGIRLTNNDMLHIGDWITVPSAGANGRVEEITLTMVKVRNFDNTIITLSPQSLVDGSFQNWLGMEEKEGRRQVRKIYFDFRSLKTEHPEKPEKPKNPDIPGNPEKTATPNPLPPTTNITRFRHDIEQWLQQNPKVATDKTILVKHSDTLQASGCCVEIVFWLKAKDAITYEHDTSDIMEYIYAKAADYGLSIYQPNIEK